MVSFRNECSRFLVKLQPLVFSELTLIIKKAFLSFLTSNACRQQDLYFHENVQTKLP